MLPILSSDSLTRLSSDLSLGGFDCGVRDLNEFLRDDALNHMRALMSVTYVVKNGADVVAYFSLLNDSLKFDPDKQATKTAWNRMTRKIPNAKRLRSYPAVKLGRLAVNRPMQRGGFGAQILDWMKMSFVTMNKTGCRFIIVDALNNEDTLRFYQRNDFEFLIEDGQEKTRLMYYDLKPFQDIADRANASASGSSSAVSACSEDQS